MRAQHISWGQVFTLHSETLQFLSTAHISAPPPISCSSNILYLNIADHLLGSFYIGHLHTHIISDWHRYRNPCRYKPRVSRGMGRGMRLCTPTKPVPLEVSTQVQHWVHYIYIYITVLTNFLFVYRYILLPITSHNAWTRPKMCQTTCLGSLGMIFLSILLFLSF